MTNIKHHVITWDDVVKHVDKICNDIIRSDVEVLGKLYLHGLIICY